MKKTISVLIVAAIALALLAGCSGDSKSGQAGGNNINVYVKDESGKPVAGVKVQACDDTLCMAADTDSEGHAGFSTSSNTVEVHILKVPAGYAADKDAVYKTDSSGSVTVTLKSE